MDRNSDRDDMRRSVQSDHEPPARQPATDVDHYGRTGDRGFPDLSNYTEGTSGTYQAINRPRIQGFMFSTPNGLICVSNAYPDVEYETVGCRGPMPHEGPGVWSVDASRGQQTTVESITGDPDYASAVKDPPPVLPPMRKLIAAKGDAVCAVDDKGMTACRVGDHGFVLTSKSTQLF
jgi:hypothetical protein